jgi:peptidoglycan/xylan/chitin deacetylase (PgdA/CDA1 family)
MPALMYHDIVPEGAEDSSGFPGRGAALYKVTPESFEAHLRALRADVVGTSDFCLTFDDGGVSALTAADALERHGLRGHFFVTVNYIGTRGFVDGRAIRELRERGHVVGSHSCSHPLRMGHCSWDQLRDEWTRSRDVLSELVGETIQTASVPGGDYAPAVAETAARAGFTTLFTSEPSGGSRPASGLTVRGRFTIQRWSTADTVSALARGAWLPCARQAAVWNAKKMGKRLWGKRYLRTRTLVLGQRDDVRWGDRPDSTS